LAPARAVAAAARQRMRLSGVGASDCIEHRIGRRHNYTQPTMDRPYAMLPPQPGETDRTSCSRQYGTPPRQAAAAAARLAPAQFLLVDYNLIDWTSCRLADLHSSEPKSCFFVHAVLSTLIYLTVFNRHSDVTK